MRKNKSEKRKSATLDSLLKKSTKNQTINSSSPPPAVGGPPTPTPRAAAGAGAGGTKTQFEVALSVAADPLPARAQHAVHMPVVPPATSDGGGTCVDPPSDSEVDVDDDDEDEEEEEVDFYADSSYDVVT